MASPGSRNVFGVITVDAEAEPAKLGTSGRLSPRPVSTQPVALWWPGHQDRYRNSTKSRLY
jgi:hypothetical protein